MSRTEDLMREWIVELQGGERQLVSTWALDVRDDGHLLGAGAYEIGWAPGVWRRFWPRPEQDRVDRLRATLAVCEELIDRATDDVERAILTAYCKVTRETLAQAETNRGAA